ncbi:MAG TPA: urate hydroxylase PuuD, partial [Myxococcales bacterium]|nr:urate hydroxylase PuuD [Myxococcales bacterium]
GAAFTWITGFCLLAMVYYMTAAQGSTFGKLVLGGSGAEDSGGVVGHGAAIGISVAAIVVIFFVYDVLWKAMQDEKKEMTAVIISFVGVVALAFGLQQIFDGRAMFIHMGALFGTIMAMNVWMRIWPAQKKIIGGVKGTNPAPDPSFARLAGLRSKHNTYLSFPLVLFMVSNHYSPIYDNNYAWAVASAIVLIGWFMSKRLYVLSASPATAYYGAPAAAATSTPAAPAAGAK